MHDEVESLREEVRRLRKSLADLTPSVDILLKRRGFKIYRKEPSGDLVIPAGEYLDGFYEMLKKYSFRLFLRDVIKHQKGFTPEDVARYANCEVTDDYIRYLEETGLVEEAGNGFRLIRRPIKSFGETLEWFLAEIFKREFSTEAIWGIKAKRPNIGGDYDLIAKMDGTILYMEIKSSPPKQVYQSEISAFLDRVADLAAEISIFFVDTELRMKDKIVPMFEEELRKRGESHSLVERMERELFQISGGIFIINAKNSIEANIGAVVSRYFRRKQ